MEAFSDFERNPTMYVKIRVRNENTYTFSDCLGILPRSGEDRYLNDMFTTGYSTYNFNIKAWYMLRSKCQQ